MGNQSKNISNFLFFRDCNKQQPPKNTRIYYHVKDNDNINYPQKYPFISIGLLQIFGEGDGEDSYKLGTAFLIGSNILMTCAHNIYNRQSKKYNKKIKYSPSGVLSQFQQIILRKDKTFFMNQKYTVAQINYQKYDYAIIIISKSQQKQHGYLKLQENIYQIGKQIIISGYPSRLHKKGKESKMKTLLGTIKLHKQGLLYYNCETQSGHSGSPLLIFNEQQKCWSVIGVHIQSKDADNNSCGIQINKQVINTLNTWLTLNICMKLNK